MGQRTVEDHYGVERRQIAGEDDVRAVTQRHHARDDEAFERHSPLAISGDDGMRPCGRHGLAGKAPGDERPVVTQPVGDDVAGKDGL